MKKIIILLLSILLSACSVVKPAETLSSMQTEPESTETTVADTPETIAPTETIYPASEIEAFKPAENENTAQETALANVPTATVESDKETLPTVPREDPKEPTETVKPETPVIPETVETSPESVAEPPKAEFDVSTTGLTLQRPTRFKSGFKSIRRRWTAGTIRQPPTPWAVSWPTHEIRWRRKRKCM